LGTPPLYNQGPNFRRVGRPFPRVAPRRNSETPFIRMYRVKSCWHNFSFGTPQKKFDQVPGPTHNQKFCHDKRLTKSGSPRRSIGRSQCPINASTLFFPHEITPGFFPCVLYILKNPPQTPGALALLNHKRPLPNVAPRQRFFFWGISPLATQVRPPPSTSPVLSVQTCHPLRKLFPPRLFGQRPRDAPPPAPPPYVTPPPLFSAILLAL